MRLNIKYVELTFYMKIGIMFERVQNNYDQVQKGMIVLTEVLS